LSRPGFPALRLIIENKSNAKDVHNELIRFAAVAGTFGIDLIEPGRRGLGRTLSLTCSSRGSTSRALRMMI
jgi:hypothetical protein